MVDNQEDEKNTYLSIEQIMLRDKALNYKEEKQCQLFTFAKCLNEKKYTYCNKIHSVVVKAAKLAEIQNPDITKTETETILNKGVELTDQTREGIINQTSW